MGVMVEEVWLRRFRYLGAFIEECYTNAFVAR